MPFFSAVFCSSFSAISASLSRAMRRKTSSMLVWRSAHCTMPAASGREPILLKSSESFTASLATWTVIWVEVSPASAVGGGGWRSATDDDDGDETRWLAFGDDGGYLRFQRFDARGTRKTAELLRQTEDY